MNAPLLLIVAGVAGCLYAYAGYPLLLLLLARVRPRPVRAADVLPSVTVICAAHDEEAVIEAKIRNTLALDYPPERLRLVIASDGSTDRTEAIARRFAGPRVRVLSLGRVGKMAALERAVRKSHGAVLVFTDANVLLERDAVRSLVRPLADPSVGGVCGTKRLRPRGDSTGEGEGLYWRYDQAVKALETRVGSVYGSDGALYAIRRRLYQPVANGSQADDLAISARVVLQGYRLVYEPAAVCWEDAPADGMAELRRKVRVANHGLRAVLDLWEALLGAPVYGLQLLSHKVLRHMVPLFLLLILTGSAALALQAPLFRLLLAAQAAFYALALMGWLGRASRAGRHPLLSVPYYFSLVNTAAALALVELLRGTRRAVWSPRSGLP